MSNAQKLLLRKIMDFQMGSEDDALSFSARLSRENSWSKDYSDRCIDEYKKFVYLASISDKQVTPSDQIDQVWHLHLTYTKSYWLELCQEVLNQSLHHEPTKGGRMESDRLKTQYQATLDKYLETFGESPPEDIWPSPNSRFRHADKFIRLNKANHWILRKPSELLLAVLTIPLFLVACTKNESDSDFWLYLKIAFGVYVIYRIVRWLGDSAGGGKGGSGGSGCGGCSSGCGGCGG